jgi:hypothetical protein
MSYFFLVSILAKNLINQKESAKEIEIINIGLAIGDWWIKG